MNQLDLIPSPLPSTMTAAAFQWAWTLASVVSTRNSLKENTTAYGKLL